MALNLSHLDGSNGFRLDGVDAVDFSGWSVARAGDVNGDGFDDLIVGAPGANGFAGESYVVFGTDTGFAASLDLAALDGSNGFRLDGIDAGDESGRSVAGAGDVNGDGIDDLIIGAPGADAYRGESYVVFGTNTGFAASLDLAALDGSNGFRLDGIDVYDGSGGSVAGAGDVNGDGFDDLIVGAYRAGGYTGESYVVFGADTGFAASLDLAALDGSNGFRLDGVDEHGDSGFSVAGAGDVNGDGIDDLIVGAPGISGYYSDVPGKSYVVFGTDNGFAASLDLSGLDGSNGFRLDGSGGPVAGAGDVNGDGIDDLIVGAGADASYLVFGTDTGFAASLDLSALDGSNGFRLDGSGSSVAGAGDVNGDGIDDLIVGADFAGNGGESYVVFGTDAGFAASLDLAALDASSGFRLGGVDAGGSSSAVAGAGDVNGDGFDDLIVGVPGADPDGDNAAGESYVVFGSALLGGANDAPLAAADAIHVGTFEQADVAADNGSGSDRDSDFDDLSVVAINGTSVAPGGSATLASGLRVTLLSGTEVRFDAPGTALGTSLSDSFVYEISDGRGGSAGATVTVDFIQDKIALPGLDGSNGFRLDGVEAYDHSGASVAGAGDVNGDGIDDLIIGAPENYSDAGEAYVIFGTDTGFAASLDLAALDGTNGFRLDGIDAYDESGASVAGAGDVNGDGFDDLIVGAPGAGNYSAGASYVVFGTDNGFAASLDLSALDGSNGFRLDGVDAYNGSGLSVAGAGDVNGDGIDDLIVGASDADPDGNSDAGESYVVFGTDAGFAASLDLAALDGANGFRLDGVEAHDQSGASVAGAGDINGDGFDDLIVGASFADPDGNSYPGESYVIFGTDAGFAASLDLAALDGANGFRLDGVDAGDLSGRSVAGAGDVNGDGIDDLIIGATGADPDGRSLAGESYVVFGTDTGFAASLDLSALDGSNGFRLDGIDARDNSGTSVAGAGDFNGDGFDDLIVGAPDADPEGNSYASYAGESYVVFGTDTGFAASLDLGALDGSNGFRLPGIDAVDYSGTSVAGAGDVNGDGFDDLIVGAPGNFMSSTAGESYVVFGFSTDEPQTPIFGGQGRDVLAGTDASESFHPGGGFDFVTTGGGSDTVFFDDLAGQRDVLTVADFNPLADTLDLRGAIVAATLESDTRTVLLLDGPDGDMIVLLGLAQPPPDLLV